MIKLPKSRLQISFQVVKTPYNQMAMEVFSALVYMLFLKIIVLLSTQTENTLVTRPQNLQFSIHL